MRPACCWQWMASSASSAQTAPRADPVAFRILTGQLKVALANREGLPDTVFDEALDAALSQNHVRAQPLTPARVKAALQG